MKKVYKKLSEEQIKRGVIFSSSLSRIREEELNGTVHEVLNTDSDKEETINRLKDDSFFNSSDWKFNILRSGEPENFNIDKDYKKKEHIKDLIKVFNLNRNIDLITVYNKLRRIEAKAHKLMEDRCNGLNETEEEHERKNQEILNKLDFYLKFKEQKIPVFLNGDPRGYALKIEDDFIRKKREEGINFHTDMGGYGIISPDLRVEE